MNTLAACFILSVIKSYHSVCVVVFLRFSGLLDVKQSENHWPPKLLSYLGDQCAGENVEMTFQQHYNNGATTGCPPVDRMEKTHADAHTQTHTHTDSVMK